MSTYPSDEVLNSLGQSGYALGYQLLHNHQDAEDMTQESLSILIRKWDTFDSSRASVKTWFLTIVRNRAIDQIRKKKPQILQETVERSNDLHTPTPDQQAETSELRQSVRNAIESLPREQRELILLRDYHGLKYAEIASMLDIPIGTVMSRLSRVRNQLRQDLFKLQGTES